MAEAGTAAALTALAAANPRELHRRRADGVRLIDGLHEQCRAAGLCPAPAQALQWSVSPLAPPSSPPSQEEERYFAVFDAALANRLGVWVIDYVELVCADRYLTSNDPLEAWLLDGEFVKAWCSTCLKRAEQAAVGSLTSDQTFAAFSASGQLQQQLAQARVLAGVLRSLDRIRSGGRGASIGSGGQDRWVLMLGGGGGWGGPRGEHRLAQRPLPPTQPGLGLGEGALGRPVLLVSASNGLHACHRLSLVLCMAATAGSAAQCHASCRCPWRAPLRCTDCSSHSQ